MFNEEPHKESDPSAKKTDEKQGPKAIESKKTNRPSLTVVKQFCFDRLDRAVADQVTRIKYE